MSIGPTGMIGSFAGSPLSQTKGTEAERAQQEASNQARQAQADRTAESAAGIRETEQDEQAADRDADGRRLWGNTQQSEDAAQNPADAPDPKASRDATGQRGTQIDLSG